MSPRAYRVAVVTLLVVHAVMLVELARITPWATDEPFYLKAGLAIRNYRDWGVFETILHGPLPFLANQLSAACGAPTHPFEGYIFWGRLGMLPFALVCAWFLAKLAEGTVGRTAAVAALALHCLNPAVLANASLMTCDMALACGWVVVLYATWRYLTEPGLLRLALVGGSLGLALATKYLALFLIPVLAVVVVAATLGGFRPGLWFSRARAGLGARLADLLPATLVCAVVALPTLHTCYLWAPGGYKVRELKDAPNPRDPEAGPLSDTLRSLVQQPLVPQLVGLLPEPFVRGIDFQKRQAQGGERTVFLGDVVDGHPAFYLVSMAVKLPLALLLLIAVGMLVRGPPLSGRAWLLLGAGIVLLLAYLSFFSTLQMGIRYVLPVLPLLCVFGGRAVQSLWSSERGVSGRRVLGRCVVGACAVGIVVFHATAWPHYRSAFNWIAGDRPYLWFSTGSNLAWPYRASERPDEVQRRHRYAHWVGLRDGPRLGKCFIYGRHLGGEADPRDGGKVYHWLRRFDPIDRFGPWFVFDATEPAFRRAVRADSADPDKRGLVELAIALMAVGQFDKASACLENNDDPDADVARRAVAAGLGGEPTIDAYAVAMMSLGRADVVVRLGDRVSAALQAQALFQRSAYAEAAAILERESADRKLADGEVNLLLASYRYQNELEKAVATLDRFMPAEDHAQYANFVALRNQIQGEIDGREHRPDLELMQRR